MSDSTPSAGLDVVEAFGEPRYESIDLTGLVAFTLQWLQDRSIPTTFENIVVAAFRMFPARFSLEGFPSYPDAARLGRTLLQLGPKYRNWARGSVQKGFVLTQSGHAKVARVANDLSGEPEGSNKHLRKTNASKRTMDLAKEITLIEQSALFRAWRSGRMNDQMSMELFDALGAYAYTPARALRDRVTTLENAAAQVGRPELVKFLRALRKVFVVHFRGNPGE